MRDGVLSVMRECREQSMRMGVTTTTSRSNLEALLQVHLGRQWSGWFDVLVCGEDVERKKPSPEVYLRALQSLCLPPLETLAIEDSPGGVSAARAADCPVVITRSAYFAQAPIDAALAIGPGLHTLRGWRPALAEPQADRRVRLDDLRHWHRLGNLVSDFP